MKTADIKKLRRAMEKSLDSKRYEHTLGVAYTAAALAMRYEASILNAQTAGLLHDCAKCLTDEKKLSICAKHNISINEIERGNPYLLHAKVGSYLAMKEYHVEDADIINAILNHTTGRPGMSLLEKIIFIADYIEPNRIQAPNLKEIRKMAFVDLDRTLLMVLGDTLEYLKGTNSAIDPMTQKTYDYFEQLSKENEHEKSEASEVIPEYTE